MNIHQRARRQPWRDVTAAHEFDGRGSVLGPDTNRMARWWELTLTCGHTVERSVRYGPRTKGRKHGRRTAADVTPPRARVRCGYCPATEKGNP